MVKILTKSIINKIKKASDLIDKHKKLVNEIEKELTERGVDVHELRCSDNGTYVDAVDYGNGLDVTYFEEVIEDYMVKKEDE